MPAHIYKFLSLMSTDTLAEAAVKLGREENRVPFANGTIREAAARLAVKDEEIGKLDRTLSTLKRDLEIDEIDENDLNAIEDMLCSDDSDEETECTINAVSCVCVCESIDSEEPLLISVDGVF